MSKILIHIGSGKTGTSSIQNALHIAEKNGTLEGATYPSISGVAHHNVANALQPLERLKRGYSQKYSQQPELKERDDAATFEDLAQTIHDNENVILSSEYFCSLKVQEIRKLREELQAQNFDGEVQICIYVRDPITYYTSIVQQKCKASSEIVHPQQFNYNFRRMIQSWDKVFRGRVVVREFSGSAFEGGNVVSDFCAVASSFFGCSITAETVTANRSLSLESLFLLHHYRRTIHGERDDQPTEDTNRLIDILQLEELSKGLLPLKLLPGVPKLIYDRHCEHIEWLWNEYGIDFRCHFNAEQQQYSIAKEQELKSALRLENIFSGYDERKVSTLQSKLTAHLLNP